MKKKLIAFLIALGLATFFSFATLVGTEDSGDFSFTTSCGTYTTVFYGTPAQQWPQAVAYAESFMGCAGEVSYIVKMAPAENPPS